MTSRDFCYWLQGYFELQSNQQRVSSMSLEQVEIIKKHLAMVFKHEIDPSHGTPEHQKELQEIHDALVKTNERVEEVARRPMERRDTPYTC
jgi:hypothetical protein